jgi:DNA segregation ATPase FtsK/SpoIIIE-like protein
MTNNTLTVEQRDKHDWAMVRYAKAVSIAEIGRSGSTSHLQRKMGVGYNQACRYIERMEAEGIISRPDSNGARHWIGRAQQSDRDWLDEDTWASIPEYMHRHIMARAAAHRNAAADSEREACALIAEDERDTQSKDFHDVFSPKDAYVDACNDIAAAIRARTALGPDHV